jgi:hypothetical protein
MCFLILEIATLVAGIVALVKGKISFTRTLVVRGVMARVIGVVLMLPLPLSFFIIFAIGFVMAANGKGQKEIENSVARIAALVPIGTYVVCALLAVILGAIAPKRPAKRRLPNDFDDEDHSRHFPDEYGAHSPVPGTEGSIQASTPPVRRPPMDIEAGD